MSAPRVVSVAPGSPAGRAGIEVGDELVALNGSRPRDVLEYRGLVDGNELDLLLARGGTEVAVEISKRPGEPLGAEVHSALFDELRTCDNHCEFCFIYQLPRGLRESLYVKDDDYRLSFLYGNYTTLTRFTEADLERVVTEKLSPLNVSIHTTDPVLRSEMLRNRRGGPSLRWLSALLDHGVTVHGQIVVCPGVNDGRRLHETLSGVLDRYPKLASLCVVPLGVSRFNTEDRLRPHSPAEAGEVLATVHDWQGVYRSVLGRRLVFAADEYYLMADEELPSAESYEGFAMHEDGIGMGRALEQEFVGQSSEHLGVRPGFFSWVDGAPPEGYRLPRTADSRPESAASSGRTVVLTSVYGARLLGSLLSTSGFAEVDVCAVENHFFGGNIAVAGLLVGEDIARTLHAQSAVETRFLLPDVCLSGGRFLDGSTPDDLPRHVEIIPTDGHALRAALAA